MRRRNNRSREAREKPTGRALLIPGSRTGDATIHYPRTIDALQPTAPAFFHAGEQRHSMTPHPPLLLLACEDLDRATSIATSIWPPPHLRLDLIWGEMVMGWGGGGRGEGEGDPVQNYHAADSRRPTPATTTTLPPKARPSPPPCCTEATMPPPLNNRLPVLPQKNPFR